MMRIFFSLLILVHGLIHLMGFAKAFQLASLNQITIPVSRFSGLIWLLTALLLILAAALFLFRVNTWWIPGSLGLLLSVSLILNHWTDSKWGMIPNLILLVALFVNIGGYCLKYRFAKDTRQSLSNMDTRPGDALMLEDLAGLPIAVRNYIIYSGSVGKPRIQSFRAILDAQIRQDSVAAWIPLKIEQYNVIDPLTRLFYMNGKMKGLPVAGYHRFKDGHAFMDIRLFSLFRVQYQEGWEMDIAETVTFFNDLCILAPGALVSKKIKWEEIGPQRVKAIYTEKGIRIQAILFFNEQNQLISFESDDRYYLSKETGPQKVKWVTPVSDYKDYHGYRLASRGEAVWHFPEGPLSYIRVDLRDIRYNSPYLSISGKGL